MYECWLLCMYEMCIVGVDVRRGEEVLYCPYLFFFEDLCILSFFVLFLRCVWKGKNR